MKLPVKHQSLKEFIDNYKSLSADEQKNYFKPGKLWLSEVLGKEVTLTESADILQPKIHEIRENFFKKVDRMTPDEKRNYKQKIAKMLNIDNPKWDPRWESPVVNKKEFEGLPNKGFDETYDNLPNYTAKDVEIYKRYKKL